MDDKTILITGGTGSLGRQLIKTIFSKHKPKKVVIFSRDEYKQSLLKNDFDYDGLRYFLGDVRDKDRLRWAFKGVDYVIHAAALKQIPALEYNPSEAVKTNILGSLNVIEACVEAKVKKAVLISTDKAVNPANLYGATKLAAEKLFLTSNAYMGTKFSFVRYGNVLNSRGSVVELFLRMKREGLKEFPITDERMTRFWITLQAAAEFVLDSLGQDGEIFIPKIPSMKITDLARAIEPECTFKITGIRPGEKLHESLGDYDSDTNDLWLTKEELRRML